MPTRIPIAASPGKTGDVAIIDMAEKIVKDHALTL